MKDNFEDDIENSLAVLRSGGLILYPTDTIWGIGCDATNEDAVSKVFALKNRNDEKALVVLVAGERDIIKYVTQFDPAVYDYLERTDRPVTMIYEGATGLADNLLGPDGSVGIRIVNDDFCRTLIKRLGKPIVSTSANISGEPSPANYSGVDAKIKTGVDYVVQHRQKELDKANASMIVKWNRDATVTVIRS